MVLIKFVAKSGRERLSLVVALLMLGGCASGNRPLQLIHGADAQYPQSARQQGVEGFVRLAYRVTVEGKVEAVTVIESKPPGIFDAVAVAAVRRWRYNAPKLKGQAVEAPLVTSKLEFKLADGANAKKYDGY